MNSARFAKRMLTTAVALLFLFLLANCGPPLSIHPLYTDKDVTFDPALLGTWADPTDKNGSPLVFERGGNNSYKAIVRLNDNTNVDEIFEVHLVKLNGRLFLDAVQRKNRISGQEADIGIAVPAHIVARVSIEKNSLQLNLLDGDWIKRELKSGRTSISHEEIGNDLVITASTPELQKFVLGHADDEEAFGASSPLQRKK